MAKPKVYILEGHRNSGKSTVARILRNKVNYSTLINCTGFPTRGTEGLRKISNYYTNFLDFLENSSDAIFIFDRFMFSEVVYSRIYKDYDFQVAYEYFMQRLCEVADVELLFFELSDDEELKRRMGRDKALFADIADDLQQLRKQRQGYAKLYREIRNNDYNLVLHKFEAAGTNSNDLAKRILATVIK